VRHENLGRLLMDSFRYFRERTLVNLRAHGFNDLNPVHAAMLRRVDEGGTTISDIAQRMGVTKQAAAQLVTKAEKLNYVGVTPSPTDSRKKMVRCTARGRRFLGSLEGVVEDSVRDVAAVIGAQRLHDLEETLKLIAAQGRQVTGNGKRMAVVEAAVSVGDARGRR
jgi:DNA-binding MarR family transcriptional regulator